MLTHVFTYPYLNLQSTIYTFGDAGRLTSGFKVVYGKGSRFVVSTAPRQV